MRLLYALLVCFVIVAEIQGFKFIRRTIQRVIKKHYVTATGTVKCKVDNKYQPLPFVKVELLDDELVGNTKMADGRTDINGRFAVTGSGRDVLGKPDPKIKVVYDYSGKYGSMLIKDRLGFTRYYRTGKRSYSRYVSFDINIDDEHCRAYFRFYHDGLKYYYNTVGSKAPYGTLRVTSKALIGTTPYAPYTKIKLPGRADPISSGTAKHEFAHTIRHYYDGNYAHFLADAGRFWYLRSHSCSSETNPGFAFNEGWAEYWENACHCKLHPCSIHAPGFTGSNYRIEGNVASALKRLAAKCGTSRAQMVDVLKYNRGNIHSFCDFNYRHGLRFRGCKLTVPKCSCLSKIRERSCKNPGLLGRLGIRGHS